MNITPTCALFVFFSSLITSLELLTASETTNSKAMSTRLSCDPGISLSLTKPFDDLYLQLVVNLSHQAMNFIAKHASAYYGYTSAKIQKLLQGNRLRKAMDWYESYIGVAEIKSIQQHVLKV